MVGSLWSQFGRLTLENYLLYRRYESEDGKSVTLQLCLPRDLVPDVLKLLHDLPTSGHLRVNKTAERVKARYYWKDWHQDVEGCCRSCRKCGERNPPVRKARAPLQTSHAGYPMERVALDVLGPLPTTGRGNRYILVVSDYFTKWPEAFAIEDHKAPTVAKKLVNEWVTRYGVIQNLHSDQGRDFESQVFQHMATMLKVNKTRTTPYHPESSGMVERINRTLEDMLSKVVNNNEDTGIPDFPKYSWPTGPQSTCQLVSPPTVCSSAERLACRPDLIVSDHQSPSQSVPQFVQGMKERFNEAHELAREKLVAATRRYKVYYDARGTRNPVKVGDRVWRNVSYVKKELTRKLARPWHGPYIIIKKLSDVVYHIKKEDGRKRLVVHFNSLKPCFTPKKAPEARGSDPNGGCTKGRQTSSGTAVSDWEEGMWFLAQPNSACRPPPEPNVNPPPASEPVEHNSADPSSSSALPMTAAYRSMYRSSPSGMPSFSTAFPCQETARVDQGLPT